VELAQAMDEAVKENNYPNAWGYSGSGPAPYYLVFGQTPLSHNPSMTTNNFSILVTGGRIFFTTPTAFPASLFLIYNPLGKLVHKNTVSRESNSWDLTFANGQKIPDGNYVAVYKDGANTVSKSFAVIK
jgi:hypothetical protein